MKIITRSEAAVQGLTKYFTGKACKNGHIKQRYVSNGVCMGCNKQRAFNDKAKRNAYAKQRYAENKGIR